MDELTPQPKKRDGDWMGVALLAVAHALAALVILLLGENGFLLWTAFGVIQLLYGVPLERRLRKSGRPRAARGVWLGMGLTFLANAGCWGYFLSVGIVH